MEAMVPWSLNQESRTEDDTCISLYIHSTYWILGLWYRYLGVSHNITCCMLKGGCVFCSVRVGVIENQCCKTLKFVDLTRDTSSVVLSMDAPPLEPL